MPGLLLFVDCGVLGGDLVPVELEPSATVRDLRQAVEQAGVAGAERRLVTFGGQVLHAEAELSECGVSQEARLSLGDPDLPKSDSSVTRLRVHGIGEASRGVAMNGEYRRVSESKFLQIDGNSAIWAADGNWRFRDFDDKSGWLMERRSLIKDVRTSMLGAVGSCTEPKIELLQWTHGS
eukprot:TRINITY_DN46928_c0_g1_i1.p2 TRINITY_DN46928_c0_g1~~TRINITY_DN46928_c0_g1_i1.p2  ORF type:complete len:179 (+),score=42.69 TRINITY_DN46928_c0_g1_i1:73-609(+)